ncbi:MAG: cyclophilin-like family protein, partial [Burkholderiaceae bacterium]
MELKFKSGLIKIKPIEDNDTAKIALKSSGFKAKLNTWGEEIYFKTPFKGVKLDDKARDLINLGEIAYWVEGNSIAIG